MRHIIIPFAFLFLAACATRPTSVQTGQPPALPAIDTRGRIIGLTAEELVQRFGVPALQIREGDSWKLQFRSRFCVLDAYLYPLAPARAPFRVTYVDTRTPSLGAIDQMSCISSFSAP